MLLHRLIKIIDCRLPFAPEVIRLREQRQWLIDLEHLLDPEHQAKHAPVNSRTVARTVETYLKNLVAQLTDPEDQQVAQHIDQSFRERWWGLFVCYDYTDLPRTNNELEQYMRRIKSAHRRIVGRKNVHDFIIRYGPFAACLDYRASLDDLILRLSQVEHEDFMTQRKCLTLATLREQKRHRFRHHQADYLKTLENRWADAAHFTSS